MCPSLCLRLWFVDAFKRERRALACPFSPLNLPDSSIFRLSSSSDLSPNHHTYVSTTRFFIKLDSQRSKLPLNCLVQITMAPSKAGAAAAPFEKEERVLCFHHDMLYEAKILDSRPTENGQSFQYRIHYKGWKNTVSSSFLISYSELLRLLNP